MERLGRLVRVQEVEPLEGFRVRLRFEDGTQKEVDLEPYLHDPIFEPVRRDMKMFRSVKVEEGTIAWENGADIDPDVLYYELTPAWTGCPTRGDAPKATVVARPLAHFRDLSHQLPRRRIPVH
jgi:hypothetical protein